MTETYRLDEKQLPTIPLPHDCEIKSIRLEGRTVEIAFEDDISRHDAIQYWKPDAKSLVMRFHLDCEPEDCEILRWVRRRKPFGRNGHYRVIGFEELSGLTEQARRDLIERARLFAPRVGVTYGRISIRHQKTKWGSCSSGGNLNFNCLLMLAPETVRDYVVVHELCHRKQMNHSEAFWAEVERVLPEYREARKWLKTHGQELMQYNTED